MRDACSKRFRLLATVTQPYLAPAGTTELGHETWKFEVHSRFENATTDARKE